MDDDARIMPLRDVLVDRPRLLLVGINPSLRSGAVGHHFAGPGNPFWRLLHAACLVPEALSAEDDQKLTRYGLALSNLCRRATRSAAELRPEEIREGIRRVRRLCQRIRPQVVAFVGVGLYRQFFRLPESGGPGPKPERLAGAPVFVVPNPSGLNAAFPGFRDKLIWYQRLQKFVSASRRTPSPRRSG